MQDQKLKKEYLAKKYFYLIISLPIIFWALAFPFIKIGLRELSSINLTIMRLLVVCIVFLLIYLIRSNKFSQLHKKDIIPIFLLGFFGIIIYHLGLNYGELYISASAASLIIATIPIFIAIFAAIFLKEKITPKIIIGIIISLIGVIIISIAGTTNSKIEITYISGAIAVLIAALMGAFYTIAGKKLLVRYSALSLTIYAFLLGIIGLIPFISMSLFKEVSSMSTTGWAVVIFLGIFPTVIGYLFWYIALEIKTSSEIGIYLYAIPVLSTIISFILFNEQITGLFIFGGIFVILGLYIVNRQERKKRK